MSGYNESKHCGCLRSEKRPRPATRRGQRAQRRAVPYIALRPPDSWQASSVRSRALRHAPLAVAPTSHSFSRALAEATDPGGHSVSVLYQMLAILTVHISPPVAHASTWTLVAEERRISSMWSRFSFSKRKDLSSSSCVRSSYALLSRASN